MKKYIVKEDNIGIGGKDCLKGDIVSEEDFYYPEVSIPYLLSMEAIEPYSVEPEPENRFLPVATAIAKLVNEKNIRYGNSAQEPLRVFSKSPASEGMLVRMDDKLSRIKNRTEPELKKNDVADFMGYLLIYAESRGWTDFSELID